MSYANYIHVQVRGGGPDTLDPPPGSATAAPRSALECRVNDYNPLLLLLWKGNMDTQFTAESSLTLAHYVTDYVTKAEKSCMQEVWQEVNSNRSIYSKLWSFGVRSLRSRECGLYEASDLLLGDHLTEKSATVKWVDVAMPHMHKHRINKKSFKFIQRMNLNDFLFIKMRVI